MSDPKQPSYVSIGDFYTARYLDECDQIKKIREYISGLEADYEEAMAELSEYENGACSI